MKASLDDVGFTTVQPNLRGLQVGEPYLLSEQEMAEVTEQFKGYGSWKQE